MFNRFTGLVFAMFAVLLFWQNSMAKIPIAASMVWPINDQSALRDADSTRDHIGIHGAPFWYWPNLPEVSVSYEAQFRVPADCVLQGVRLISLGDTDFNAGAHLSVRINSTLQSAGLDFDLAGAGIPEDHLYATVDTLDWPLSLAAGQQLSLIISPDNAAAAPSLSADGDCQRHEGQGSWLTVGNEGRQALDYDLCIQALVEFSAGDTMGPLMQFARSPEAPLANGTLPLAVYTFDRATVRSITVETSGISTFVDSLLAPDSVSVDWHLDLPLNRYGIGEFSAVYSAVDSFGNHSDSTFVFHVTQDPVTWQQESGRVDQIMAPVWPEISGSVLAVQFDLNDFAAQGLSSILPLGGQIQCSGEGRMLLHLVKDAGGFPARDNALHWVSLSTDTLFVNSSCPTWLDFDFAALNVEDRRNSSWWILQEFQSLQSVFTAVESSQTSSGNSYRLDPFVNEWHNLGNRRLHIRAKVSEEGCTTPLPFLADFDSLYQDLICWSQSTSDVNLTWVVDSLASLGGVSFRPLNGIFKAEGDSVYARNGAIVVTDAFGGALGAENSLMTPWLEFDSGSSLELTFWSYYGGFAGERAEVLMQQRSSESVGAWLTFIGESELDSLGLHEDVSYPIWSLHHRSPNLLPESNALRFAFSYVGNEASGWALDSVTVQEQVSGIAPAAGPGLVSIDRAFPNPFNPSTIIDFSLREAGPLKLDVYNLLGQRVAQLLNERWLSAGRRSIEFHPQNLSSGLYIVRIKSRNNIDHRRLLLLK